MRPDFLCIGATKAGTTWLHHNLRRHPALWLPPVKELAYFDERRYAGSPVLMNRLRSEHPYDRMWRRQLRERSREWLRGDLRTLSWDLRYFFGKRTDAWYRSLFRNAPDGAVAGEITPAYCTLPPEAVAGIRSLLPDVKLLLLLRDPVDRAWSHARMYFRIARGQRDISSIPDDHWLAHFNSETSRMRGDYPRILATWERHFPADRLFSGFFDDLRGDPDALLAGIYGFLGVDPAHGRDPATMRRKFHGADCEAGIPPRFAYHLARIYHPVLEEAARRFGGHAERCLDDAEETLARGPDRRYGFICDMPRTGCIRALRDPLAVLCKKASV